MNETESYLKDITKEKKKELRRDRRNSIIILVSMMIFLILLILAITGAIWQATMVIHEQHTGNFFDAGASISAYMNQYHFVFFWITNIIDILTIIWGIICVVIFKKIN